MWSEHALSTYLLLAAGLFGLASTTIAQAFTHWKLRSRSGRARAKPLEDDALPAISVLKPLKGLDEDLYENLASMARQQYPRFELLLGVDDAADPALRVARRLQADFPEVSIRVLARAGRSALNPKVANLLNLMELAQHDCVLVSDSNARVAPGHLRAIASELVREGAALVSNPIIGCGEETIGATLENLQLDSFVIAGVCFGDALGHPIVVGKSMLMRRSDLHEVGGFHGVADVMAEDYVLGRRFHEAGKRVVLSSHPVYTHNRTWSVSRCVSRHLRWAQIRRWGSLSTFFAELLMYPLPWLMLAAVSARAADARPLMWLALTAIACRVALDGLLLWDVRRERPSATMLALIPLRDLVLLALWSVALVRRSVEWRGNRRRITAGTRLLPVLQERAVRAAY